MYFVYILLCNDFTLYTGSTNNVKKRFQEHMLGKGAKYTKSHPPLRIVHIEQFASKSDALKREIEIKSWTRQEKIEKLRLKI